jgi:hypothetical protein
VAYGGKRMHQIVTSAAILAGRIRRGLTCRRFAMQMVAACLVVHMATASPGHGPSPGRVPGLLPAPQSSAPQNPNANSEIILTETHPTSRTPANPSILKGSSPHVAITLARIANPKNVAFSVEVALEPQESSQRTSPKPNSAARVPPASEIVGQLGVYPSDQPGRYQLDISLSLKRLHEAGQDLAHISLRLTLKLMHPGQAAPGLEVVVSPPEWTDKGR